jgi:hypothetical protein
MALIIKQQDEIEVFANDNGQIEIRANLPGETQIIAFSKEFAGVMCEAIQSAKRELEEHSA